MLNVKKLAVLIDADNISADTIEHLLLEINKFGIASVKRIYGDWTSPQMNKWKTALLPHAITPIQQFSYTNGKNATDMAMVIDAMDLLYSGTFNGFCLVSSDSDFTRLASRIRENGLEVIGFGQQKTPEAFVKACDKFVHIELLMPESEKNPPSIIPIINPTIHPPIKNTPSAKVQTAPTENSSVLPKIISTTINPQNPTKTILEPIKNTPATTTPPITITTQTIKPLIKKAIESHSNEQGWVKLGTVGSYISRVKPDFDVRHFGFDKLSNLIKSMPDDFEMVLEGSVFSVRIKITLNPLWNKETLNGNNELKSQLTQHIKNHANQNGWAPFNAVVKSIGKEFFTKFGYQKSSDLIKQLQGFELRNINDTLCIKKYWSISKIIHLMNSEISSYLTDEHQWMPIFELSKKMLVNDNINLISLGFSPSYEDFILNVRPEQYEFKNIFGQKYIRFIRFQNNDNPI